MDYPLFERIRERLNVLDKTVEWLAAGINKSPRWVYDNKKITDISLEKILVISNLLEFDLLSDYNQWLKENNQTAITIIQDPEVKYVAKNALTVEIKISGSYTDIGMHFADFLKTLQKESLKYGLTIE